MSSRYNQQQQQGRESAFAALRHQMEAVAPYLSDAFARLSQATVSLNDILDDHPDLNRPVDMKMIVALAFVPLIIIAAYIVDSIFLTPLADFFANLIGAGPVMTKVVIVLIPGVTVLVDCSIALGEHKAKQEAIDTVDDRPVKRWKIFGWVFLAVPGIIIWSLIETTDPTSGTAKMYIALAVLSTLVHALIIKNPFFAEGLALWLFFIRKWMKNRAVSRAQAQVNRLRVRFAQVLDKYTATGGPTGPDCGLLAETMELANHLRPDTFTTAPAKPVRQMAVIE